MGDVCISRQNAATASKINLGTFIAELLYWLHSAQNEQCKLMLSKILFILSQRSSQASSFNLRENICGGNCNNNNQSDRNNVLKNFVNKFPSRFL
jgi:hypothetical protein